ncbi:MAG: hypothetical protein M0030_03405 [Actinomycetota bacterium]|nr:hypothetical protein [Actinomycetota bacterium]
MRTADWTALGDAVAILTGALLLVRAIYRFLVGVRDNTSALQSLTKAVEGMGRRLDSLSGKVERHDADLREIKSALNHRPRR